MHFIIDQAIFNAYPDLHIGVIIARDIDNTGHIDAVGALMDGEQHFTRALFSAQRIPDHPNIANWRQVYAAFGDKDRYRSSVEALVRRVARGDALPRINTLVDLYNLTSVKYLLPVGGEDLRRVKGDLLLRYASGTERFTPLGTQKNDPPSAGEIIYADDEGCICRRFNWRETDRTKLTAQTKHALLVLEGLPPVINIEVKEAAAFLSEQIRKFCGGTTTLYLLNQRFPSVTI